MKTIQTKIILFALLLSTTVPFLLAEMDQVEKNLFKAAKMGEVVGVEKAIAAGANVDVQDEEDVSALIYAAEEGHLAAVRLLIEGGANVNAKDGGNTSVLMYAARHSNSEMVRLLIANHANVNAKDEDDTSVLMYAVYFGNLGVVKFLIENGANINVQDGFGQTALMKAAAKGSLEVVRLLIESGANVDVQDGSGQTAIEIAEKEGKIKIVEIMMPFVIEKIAIAEKQRQKLTREQDGIDLISMDDITKEPLSKLMILNKRLFLRKTIMDHMISKAGSPEGILDPFTRKPIPAEIQLALLGYFSLPMDLLKSGGPIYEDAKDLQQRENWIVMTGEPETEKEKKELEELENEAAGFRKRIRDTLTRYNYS